MTLNKVCKKHGQLEQDQITHQKGKLPHHNPILVCKLCMRERRQKYYKIHPERTKERKRKLYLQKREEYKEYSRQYRLNNPEKCRLSRQIYGINNKKKIKDTILRYKFDFTIEQYNRMLKQQNNVCAICLKPETVLAKNSSYIKSLAVDHCHQTGKIRGLLCDKCNKGIGHFNDDIELLANAILYIKNNYKD